MAGLDGFVKLLLHCDGTDASTTFTDSSDQAHTVTAVNSAQVDTAQKKFGTGSLFVDSGTEDYLSIADSSDWDLWGGDCTIDMWVRISVLPADQDYLDLFVQTDSVTTTTFFSVFNDSGTYAFNLGNGSVVDGAVISITTNTQYHFAVEFYNGLANFYLDGTKLTNIRDATPWTNPGNLDGPLTIGLFPAFPSTVSAAWIDEYRVSKGVARYRGTSFTPSTVAYSLTTPDNWWKDLATPPDPLLSISTSSQKANLFTWEPTLETAAAATAALNEFRGWFVPLTDPVRIPPRLETGDQQFEIVTFKPILRRTKSIAGSHDGTPLLHGLHDKTSQIAIKVNS